MSSCQGLSSGDRCVLNSIFNPHMPHGDAVEEQSEISEIEQGQDLEETEETKRARELEVEGIKAAESNNIQEAIDYFNSAIAIAPSHASAYNNRAQALRLCKDVKGAIEDLDKAIELSDGKGKAACQAYVQRGLIKKLEGEEEAAMEDLKKAAGLGSEFAKTLVVQLNPYAAMCNEMLAEVIGKIQRGEQ